MAADVNGHLAKAVAALQAKIDELDARRIALTNAIESIRRLMNDEVPTSPRPVDPKPPRKPRQPPVKPKPLLELSMPARQILMNLKMADQRGLRAGEIIHQTQLAIAEAQKATRELVENKYVRMIGAKATTRYYAVDL